MRRLAVYFRIAWRMAAYGLLLAFWGVFLVAFVAHMLPRFAYLAGAPIGADAPCQKPECDFSVFWPAGILARRHDFATLYSGTAFIHAVNGMLPPNPNIETFFYPPTMLLPLAAISHLPFEWGAFAWMFGGVALGAALLRLAGMRWPIIAAGLLSPAALLSTEIAQFGVLGGAVVLSGLMLAERRPALGGGLLGLLTTKPQIGALVPFVCLARRNWRALAAFCFVGALLVGASIWLFGSGVWFSYLTLGRAETLHIILAPFERDTAQGWGVSVYWMLRSFGLGASPAMIIQAACAFAAASALIWLHRRRLPSEIFVSLVVYLSLLATPYGYTSDMVAYSLVLAEAARRRGWRIDMLDTALWLWPGFCLVVSESTGLVLTPLFVALALGRTALRARAAVLPPRPTGA